MRAQEGAPRRIGILGLGCGTLAAYGRAGDTLRIYEINPLVLEIARTRIHLSEGHAGEGGGRDRRRPAGARSRAASQQFDILVMDAFSGDSVPVHLITREAFAHLLPHLKPTASWP